MATETSTPVAPVREPSDKEIRAALDQSSCGPDANLIGILQEVQERFGYLPAPALQEISRRMKVPLSRVYGVVSFYAQFYTEPRGKHAILCCRGTACHVGGAAGIIETVKRVLGIDEGQTTPDMLFQLESVACLGACFVGPAMMIDKQYFGKLTPQRVQSILETYRAKES